MTSWQELLIDLAVIAIFVGGIAQFRTPIGARRGNLTAALAFAIALALLVYRNTIGDTAVVVVAFLLGGGVGYVVSARVDMTRIPALVAFQNGAGGGAACLVSFVELTREGAELAAVNQVFGYVGLVVGGATLAGSIVAGGKLAGWFRQRPTALPAHNLLLFVLLAGGAALAVLAGPAGESAATLPVAGVAAASLALGALFAVRVGGADMPVLISFLNTFSGLAAAFVGVALGNQMLIAAGAMVGSSGFILTMVMARAMNRRVGSILVGSQLAEGAPVAPAESEPAADPSPAQAAENAPAPVFDDPAVRARRALAGATSVIIVPGYGMAVAQAQGEVATLASKLEAGGKLVRFAVHPVAGRMPGHMHVLLAEAEVEYDKLFEMDDINDDFATTDVAIIVGACDVVNPAAITVEGTPISGMPILRAHEAGAVIVCNLDEKPGYSGVPNPLYDDPDTILMLGDAKETVPQLWGRNGG
ncbi:MAG: NAD(P)(+) transhydrogenase (Re/Si-specific) subunit beta [Aeromicrobium sp.]|nr:NAD(P)(+) transhydrogenase (Re/Si-specific) subunit beta [Aeromicrobium sp.]